MPQNVCDLYRLNYVDLFAEPSHLSGPRKTAQSNFAERKRRTPSIFSLNINPRGKSGFVESSPARARTWDTRINSPLLYQLSYRGSRKAIVCRDKFKRFSPRGQDRENRPVLAEFTARGSIPETDSRRRERFRSSRGRGQVSFAANERERQWFVPKHSRRLPKRLPLVPTGQRPGPVGE